MLIFQFILSSISLTVISRRRDCNFADFLFFIIPPDISAVRPPESRFFTKLFWVWDCPICETVQLATQRALRSCKSLGSIVSFLAALLPHQPIVGFTSPVSRFHFLFNASPSHLSTFFLGGGAFFQASLPVFFLTDNSLIRYSHDVSHPSSMTLLKVYPNKKRKTKRKPLTIDI